MAQRLQVDIYAVPDGYDIFSRQMLDYYIELFGVRERLGALRRHVRLMLARGERRDHLRLSGLRSRGLLSVHDHWRYIDRNRGRVAITGTLCLLAYGLVDRRLSVVDLVELGRLGGGPVTLPGVIPIRLWPDEGQETWVADGYLFQNPYEVALGKIDATMADQSKDEHLDDLLAICRAVGLGQ